MSLPEIPGVWEATLLALASYRTWRLIAEDAILDRPRRWLLKLGTEWQEDGDLVPEGYRREWAIFLTCVYCAGFWIAVGWWVAWVLAGDWTTMFAVPWALSAAVVFMRQKLDPPED